MSEPAEVDASRAVFSGTPVSSVRTSVEALRGPARDASLRAAEAVRKADTLGALDKRVRAATKDIAAAAALNGDAVVVEVSQGPASGLVDVAFRPPPGAYLCAAAGRERTTRLDSSVGLFADQVPSSAPIRIGLGGAWNVGQDAALLSLSASPRGVWSALPWATPSLDFSLGASSLSGLLGPLQRASVGAISFSDLTGRHTLRLQAAGRELLPDKGASDEVMRSQLRTTKASAGYHFFRDTRPIAGTCCSDDGIGDTRGASVELAGLLGDVQLARAEGVWTRTGRTLDRKGTWSVCASAGLCVPLGSQATPWEDRFSLGGTLGVGPAQRLPGFATRGVGPSAARRAPASEPAGPRLVFGFGRDFQVESRLETPQPDEPRPVVVDHLGGDACASASGTLQWPLMEVGGVRLSALATGAVGSVADKVRPTLPQDLAGQVRASAAVGVGARLPGGGFAGVTVAQPLVARPGDSLQRVQFWLSFGRNF